MCLDSTYRPVCAAFNGCGCEWTLTFPFLVLEAPVRTVHSLLTWLAVCVSHPDVNDVMVEGSIEHPRRGEPVTVEVQLVDVCPSLTVHISQ